jgi:hypothetical protein
VTATQSATDRHPRQTAQPSTAQQTKEQRFSLIVPMLAGEQYLIDTQLLRERAIACIPGSLLQTRAGFHTHPNDLQSNAQRLTDLLTMSGPRLSRRLQAVMHMDGFYRRQGFALGELSQKVQQDGGIQATGEPDMPDGRIAPRGQGLKKPGGEVMTGVFEDGHISYL